MTTMMVICKRVEGQVLYNDGEFTEIQTKWNRRNRKGPSPKYDPDSPRRYQRHAGRVPAQVPDWHVGGHYDHYGDQTGS